MPDPFPLLTPELEPFPPYTGIDAGNSASDMFPDNGPVVQVEQDQPGAAGITREFVISQDGDGDIVISQGYIRDALAKPDADGNMVWGQYATLVASDSFTPLDSTDYGIWLDITLASPPTVGLPRLGSHGDVILESISSVSIVEKTPLYTGGTIADYTALILASSGHAYIYLGLVEVDGDGEATITQSSFGPFQIPAITYLTDLVIVSADAPNDVVEGSDGGARVIP